MPTKKVQKKKDRAYCEKLLDDADVTDKAIAESIYNGLHSDNPAERSKALDTAVKLKFDEVKKTDDKLEELLLANVKLDDLKRLANKCAYCKHKTFEPIRGGKSAEPTEQVGKSDNAGVLITLEGLVAGEPAAEELLKDKEEPRQSR